MSVYSFDRLVRPYLIELRIGIQGVAFDRLDLDAWVDVYNNERSHQGKMCCGRTPMQTLQDGRELWEMKVGSLN